jgi:glucan phosphoethanolaminetransferase (alkaline phosphatase superfamily)
MTHKKDNKNKDIIGWGAVYRSYGIKDGIKDAIIPFLISIILILGALVFCLDTLNVLIKVIDISLSVLPAIISLLLAAYAIVLTLFWSEYGKRIRQYKNGRSLLSNLNASFAAILLMIIGLIVCIVFQSIISFDIDVAPIALANVVNLASLFLVLFILCLSIYSLKDITINIFNLGQVTPLFDEEEDAKQQDNKTKIENKAKNDRTNKVTRKNNKGENSINKN